MQNCAECKFIHYHKHEKPILTEKYKKLYDNLIDIINEIEEDYMCTACNNKDLIQMNTNISLTDKDGKFIEVRVPEPEYWSDSIF